MSYRRVEKDIGMDKNTVKRAFDELREHGLVVVTSKGAYRGRVASTYRLTHLPTNTERASKEYLQWNDELGKLVAS